MLKLTHNATAPIDQPQPYEIHLVPVPVAGARVHPTPAETVQGPHRLPPGPSLLPFLDALVPLVQPILNRQHQPRLLALFPPGAQPLVNGEPAPRVVVLASGDRLTWAPDQTFVVAVYYRPRIGPPPAALIGRPCPTCRIPLTAETHCVICACGVALHCESDEQSGLQCARLSPSCPVCRRAIVLTEGYHETPSHDD